MFAALYFTWRLFFTLPLSHGPVAMTLGVMLLIAEGLGVLETIYHMYNIRKVKMPVKPELPPDMYPHVDVMIATHNEPTDLLYKTLNGCLHMHYPDKSKVHIYLCDDGDRPEMEALAREMGVGYYGLSGNTEAKAGNLNNALRQTHSPLVATLDADMIPTSAFLMETVPYFFLPEMIRDKNGWRKRTEEEKKGQKPIGFLQTPQSFYNEDLFQMNLYVGKKVPNEQDYFFREVNVGRTHSNTVIYCGSNTLLSRKALEEAGYIATGSLTEDFATGINIQTLGYRSIGIDTELVHGLNPTDVNSLLKQRQRWARGCVQTLRTRKFLFGPLSFTSKLSYIVLLVYWWSFATRMIFTAIPIVTALLGIAVADTSLHMMLIFWLPYYLLYNRAMYIISGSTRSVRWNNVVVTIMAPYFVIPMVMESIGLRKKDFFVTPKDNSTGKNATLRYALPHIILAVLSVLAIAKITANFTVWAVMGSIIVLYWLLVNLYALLAAIAFYVGRINYRQDERIFARIPVTLYPDGKKLYGVTADVSEGGLAVLLDAPEYLPPDQPFPLSLRYKQYAATLQARVVHVGRAGDKWKYSFAITQLAPADKSAYFQMIYDRKHTLPNRQKLKLVANVRAVLKGLFGKEKRITSTLPRIPLAATVNAMASGRVQKVTVLEFDYKTVTLRHCAALPKTITIELAPDTLVRCTRKKGAEAERAAKSDKAIYRVDQWRLLAKSPAFRKKLLGMLGLPVSVNGYTPKPNAGPTVTAEIS